MLLTGPSSTINLVYAHTGVCKLKVLIIWPHMPPSPVCGLLASLSSLVYCQVSRVAKLTTCLHIPKRLSIAHCLASSLPMVTIQFNWASTIGNSSDFVLHLKKNMYSLKQAGNNWFDTLKQSIIVRGFVQSSINPCLFIRPDHGPYRLVGSKMKKTAGMINKDCAGMKVGC
jgi:hypothetical protein